MVGRRGGREAESSHRTHGWAGWAASAGGGGRGLLGQTRKPKLTVGTSIVARQRTDMQKEEGVKGHLRFSALERLRADEREANDEAVGLRVAQWPEMVKFSLPGHIIARMAAQGCN